MSRVKAWDRTREEIEDDIEKVKKDIAYFEETLQREQAHYQKHRELDQILRDTNLRLYGFKSETIEYGLSNSLSELERVIERIQIEIYSPSTYDLERTKEQLQKKQTWLQVLEEELNETTN